MTKQEFEIRQEIRILKRLRSLYERRNMYYKGGNDYVVDTLIKIHNRLKELE